MQAIRDNDLPTKEDKATARDESSVLGAIAGCIAYEFNNILAGILLHIEAAKETIPIPKESLAILKNAEEEIGRAKHLTEELLSLTIRETAAEEIPLRFLLDACAAASDVCYVYPEKNESGFDLWVKGDRRQLEQAFRNICDYLVSISPASRIRVYLEACTLSMRNDIGVSEGKYARILLVQEDGVNIASGIEENLDPYRPGREGGARLDLIIGYAIIKLHGGIVRTFQGGGRMRGLVTYLPAAPEKGQMIPESKKSAGKILMMDDEESIRSIGEVLFGRLGYEIVTVGDGIEAVETYVAAKESGHPFDVVILDLTIPGGMGGRETIRQLRIIDENVKAIVSSGYSGALGMEDFRRFGFNASVDKPYRLETLVEAVETLIRASKE